MWNDKTITLELTPEEAELLGWAAGAILNTEYGENLSEDKYDQLLALVDRIALLI